jgi:hypothetical protein
LIVKLFWTNSGDFLYREGKKKILYFLRVSRFIYVFLFNKKYFLLICVSFVKKIGPFRLSLKFDHQFVASWTQNYKGINIQQYNKSGASFFLLKMFTRNKILTCSIIMQLRSLVTSSHPHPLIISDRTEMKTIFGGEIWRSKLVMLVIKRNYCLNSSWFILTEQGLIISDQ